MNSSIFKITVPLLLRYDDITAPLLLRDDNITVIDNNEVKCNWYLIHWFHQIKKN